MSGSRIMTETCPDCGRTGRHYGAYGVCSPCYRRARRKTHPEFAEKERARAAKWKAENRDSNRARDRQRMLDRRDSCACGNLKHHRSDRCVDCFRTRGEEKRVAIERLWAEGKSCAEIGAIFEYKSSFQPGPHRVAGWNLPNRYRQRVAA